jgi:hypothetical protein
MKKLLAVILILAVAVVGCGKKNNPLGPNTNTADKAQPTATPVPVSPGKSTVVVKALVGNQPLSNVSCSVQFTGGTAVTANTDSTGTATLVIDAAGNYTAAIPSQGDILTSALTGYCDRSKSNTITFQASGGAVSITPTAIQYDFSGGTQIN